MVTKTFKYFKRLLYSHKDVNKDETKKQENIIKQLGYVKDEK